MLPKAILYWLDICLECLATLKIDRSEQFRRDTTLGNNKILLTDIPGLKVVTSSNSVVEVLIKIFSLSEKSLLVSIQMNC